MLLDVLVFPITIFAGRQFRSEGVIRRVKFSGADLAWRAAVVTVCVIVVTTASNSIGSYFSGLFAFFPVAMGSFFVILHPRIGGPASASVAAHVQAPLIGLGLSLLAVHLLAETVGVWWSYAIGLCIGLGWNALLWMLTLAAAINSARPHAGDATAKMSCLRAWPWISLRSRRNERMSLCGPAVMAGLVPAIAPLACGCADKVVTPGRVRSTRTRDPETNVSICLWIPGPALRAVPE